MKFYVSREDVQEVNEFWSKIIDKRVKLSKKVYEGTLAECQAIAKSVKIHYRIYPRSTPGNYVNDMKHTNCRAKTTKFALYFFIEK